MGPRCDSRLQHFSKLIGFKRSGSLVLKVLETSKLYERRHETQLYEKAVARSLKELWDLRQVVEAPWAPCFNLENGSKPRGKG